MKRKLIASLMTATMIAGMLTGCGSGSSTDDSAKTDDTKQEETAEKRECYQGLPITSMAIALPLVVVLKPFLGCEFMLALHVVMLVVGILFITNFKLKKPKNVTMGAIVAVVAMAVIAILVRHYMRYMSMM